MKRLRFFFIASLLCHCLIAHADNVDDYIRVQMRRQHVPGLSLAVVRDGTVIKAKGYGLANVELGVPATADTVYEIGSITKQFTATAIMMLVEEGKIGLDEKIPAYLSGLPDAWKEVTVRQLLTHTSGIKGYTNVPGFEKLTLVPASKEEVIKVVAAAPLEFPSGDRWNYSNTGYFLLGMIIEKASGKSYADFLKDCIFTPLQMTSTQVNDLHTIIAHRASGYEWKDNMLRNADFISMTWPFAAGGIVSTVKDLSKWDAALYTNRLLKPDSLSQMWTRVRLNNGTTSDYGFGWFLDKVKGHTHVYHSGGIPGFTSHITRYPDDQLTVIVLTNQMGNTSRIGEAVAGLYLPAVAPVTYKPVEDKEPLVTAQIRRIMEQSAAGDLDKDLFTPDLFTITTTQLKQGMREGLRRLGPVKSVVLVERQAVGANREYRYRVEYKDEVFLASCTFNKEGKIAQMSLQPE